MNRRRPQQHFVRASDVAWPLEGSQESVAFPRYRRSRRWLFETRSDILLSGFLFVLLIWMGFVALTLWH